MGRQTSHCRQEVPGASYNVMQNRSEQQSRVHVPHGEPRSNPNPRERCDPNGVNVLQPHHLLLLLPRERDYRAVLAEGGASL